MNIQNHYKNISKKYNKFLFYDSQSLFNKWLVDTIIGKLDIKNNYSILDFGGGDGTFSNSIYEKSDKKINITNMDFNQNMINQSLKNKNIKSIQGNHNTIINDSYNKKYNIIILKEMIHHIPSTCLEPLFKKFNNNILYKKGKILIITRLNKVDNYPFFPLAKEIWKEKCGRDNQIYIQLLQSNNFDVTKDILEFKIKINVEEWFYMIRNCFWSIFSFMSKDEIDNGIDILKKEIYIENKFNFNKLDNTIIFSDKVVFILAKQKD